MATAAAPITLPTITVPLKLDTSNLQSALQTANALLGQLNTVLDKVKAGSSSASGAMNEQAASTEKVTAATKEAAEATIDAAEATKKHTDAQGRLRDEHGRFVSSSKKASDATKDLEDNLKKTEGTTQRLQVSLKGFVDKLNSIGGAVSAIFSAKVVEALNKSIEAASDLNESMGKSSVVFGKNDAAIQAWAKTAADKMGFSRQQAIETAATFGNLFEGIGASRDKAAAMSRTMVQLGSDLASFNNVDTKTVLQDLQSGLTGQVEPLRKYGINLSEAALKQKALDLGLITTTKGTLPDSVKMQAAYALILAKTGNAQGDFARTSGGLANQQRILDSKMTDLSATIGGILLPMKLKLVGVIENLIAKFEALPKSIQGVIVVAIGLVAGLGVVLPAVAAVVGAIGAIGVPVAAAIAAVAALGAAFTMNAGGIQDTAKKVLGPVATFIREQWAKVVAWWKDNLPIMAETVHTVVTAIQQFWHDHGERIMAIISHAWEIVKDIIGGALDAILGVLKLTMQVINGDWEGAWKTLIDTAGNLSEKLVDAVKHVFEGLGNTIALLFQSMFDADKHLLQATARLTGLDIGAQIADGILAGLQGMLPQFRDFLQGLRNQIKGFLPQPSGPHATTAAGEGGFDFGTNYDEHTGKPISDFGGGDFGAPGKKTTNPKTPAPADKNADAIADALREAANTKITQTIGTIQGAFDRLKDTLKDISDPAQLDATVKEMRRLSILITKKQAEIASNTVSAAEADLKRAQATKNADDIASAKVALIKAKTDAAGEIGGLFTGDPLSGSIGRDAKSRTDQIDQAKKDQYQELAKARKDADKEAERSASEALKLNLDRLEEERKANRLSVADYQQQLRFLLASQVAGSKEQEEVQKALDATIIEGRKKRTALIEEQDAAEAAHAVFQHEQDAKDDLKAGAKAALGGRDTQGILADAQSTFNKRIKYEIDLQYWQNNVAQASAILQNTLSPAIDRIFKGDLQGGIRSLFQSIGQQLTQLVTRLATMRLAAGIANRLFKRPTDPESEQEKSARLAQQHMDAGALSIKGAADALTKAAEAIDKAAGRLKQSTDNPDNKPTDTAAGTAPTDTSSPATTATTAINALGTASSLMHPAPGSAAAQAAGILNGLSGLGPLISMLPGGGALAALLGGAGKAGGFLGGITKIFGFDKGGLLPDVAMVHRGEMLVQPRPGSMALPAELTRAITQGRSGTTNIQVHISGVNGQGMSIPEIGREVGKHVNRQIQVARRMPAGG